MLFLQTMLARMKPFEPDDESKTGSRIAIIFNGSPLSNGDCGSGESEIRRWILENDWLDAIVMLPDQLFYNTGIFTYRHLDAAKRQAGNASGPSHVDRRAMCVEAANYCMSELPISSGRSVFWGQCVLQ